MKKFEPEQPESEEQPKSLKEIEDRIKMSEAIVREKEVTFQNIEIDEKIALKQARIEDIKHLPEMLDRVKQMNEQAETREANVTAKEEELEADLETFETEKAEFETEKKALKSERAELARQLAEPVKAQGILEQAEELLSEAHSLLYHAGLRCREVNKAKKKQVGLMKRWFGGGHDIPKDPLAPDFNE